jgi:uncharacterized protein YPO0396
METIDVIGIAAILITNASAVIGVFISLSVKIAENAKDLLALKNDMESHKSENKEDVKELKDLILRDKVENRDDHKAIICEVGALSKNLSDFKIELLRVIQKSK